MPKITQLSQLDLTQNYSYAEYLTWQIDATLELIRGKIMLMAPAPNVRHQDISANLTTLLHNHFKHKRCRVYAAPFDVRLYDRKKSLLSNQEIVTVVQPDLSIICNPEILDIQGCNGAPDWIIEILSKGNAKRDMQLKYQLYQESGVREYWLVYTEQNAIHQFVLNECGRYQLKMMYADDDQAIPQLFPELVINLADVFDTWAPD